MAENLCSDYSEEKESLSITVYEDDSDISYFNKSTKMRIANTSISKRSPLATINKSMNKSRHNEKTAANSLNMQPSTSSNAKTPLKYAESMHRRTNSKGGANTVDPFAYLSDEIMLHIFQYLPKKALKRSALVNRRFSRIVQDECLWVRMDLANRALAPGAIGKLFSRGLIVLRLAQARIRCPIFEQYFFHESYESKLQYLDLSLASIDKASLAQLLSTCRILRKLSLETVPIDISVCKQIAENKNLEVLNLAMCEGITTECASIMMISLQSLLALNISWTQLNAESVLAVASHVSPLLMRFNISGCRKTFMDSG